jgi:iron-sulfur cluster insertion protein
MFEITEKAIKAIKEIADSAGINDLTLRVKIIGSGCAGFSYDLYFDKINDMDEVIKQDDVTFSIDPLSYQYLDGATLDYSDSQFESGFRFINPNTTGSCGCGNSVSF